MAFLDRVLPQLARARVGLEDWESLDDEDRKWVEKVFEDRIFRF